MERLGRFLFRIAMLACPFSAPLVSSALAGPTVDETYRSIKDRMHASVEGEAVNPAAHRLYLLYSCTSRSTMLPSFGNGKEDSRYYGLADIAYDVLFEERTLQNSGYPEMVWRDALTEMERTSLDRFKNTGDTSNAIGFARLSRMLNDYRKKHPELHLARIEPSANEGCGAGEVTVKIVTHPKARRIQYIQKLDYDICKVKGLDVYSQCDHWEDYGGGVGAMISGHVLVLVTWPDGSTGPLRDFHIFNLPELTPPANMPEIATYRLMEISR